MSRRYQVKITASGYTYIVVTILISVAAINTGNNLLYIISSLMLALMAVSGAASLYNLFFIEWSLRPPEEIFAGIPARFSLTIRKKGGNSFFLGFETAYGSTVLPHLSGGVEQPLWLTFPARGEVKIEEVRIGSGFPLGFFKRSRVSPLGLRILVYPRPAVPSYPVPAGGGEGNERRSDSPVGEVGDELKELREYRASDPLKWIEWKATARKGRTMVREFHRTEGDTLVMDLSERSGHWERRVSHACHLVLEGHRKKLALAMRLPHGKIGAGKGEGHKRLLLEALALA